MWGVRGREAAQGSCVLGGGCGQSLSLLPARTPGPVSPTLPGCPLLHAGLRLFLLLLLG